ncbi:unnamed protein product, partial [marine sediment metagenome]
MNVFVPKVTAAQRLGEGWCYTKTVATIGPASRNPEVLSQLIRAGIDVIRLNFSHGEREEHRDVIANIRHVARE